MHIVCPDLSGSNTLDIHNKLYIMNVHPTPYGGGMREDSQWTQKHVKTPYGGSRVQQGT